MFGMGNIHTKGWKVFREELFCGSGEFVIRRFFGNFWKTSMRVRVKLRKQTARKSTGGLSSRPASTRRSGLFAASSVAQGVGVHRPAQTPHRHPSTWRQPTTRPSQGEENERQFSIPPMAFKRVTLELSNNRSNSIMWEEKALEALQVS